LRRAVTHAVDKWQAPLQARACCGTEPGLQEHCFLFSLTFIAFLMNKLVQRTVKFLTVDIWRIKRQDVTPLRYSLYSILKKLILAIEITTTKRIINSAAALTYSTLLAIVPIMAVVFAIARGFGYNMYIEQWFRESLSSQPQAAEIIVEFVNSYLVHTKSGVFLGIGLAVMLWTVIMLINNIELTFNYIWQVKKPRSVFRTITDYMAMFLLVPIVIVLTSGVSIFVATIASRIESYFLIAPLARFLIALMPYVLMSAVFVALYVFMPNTRVKLRCALVPGILAGVAMQGLQLFYIHSQIWVSSYNAIYGSFAALPLFMLWVQISWIICLFGAELCYTNQNLEDFAFRAKTGEISHRYKLMLCVMLAGYICRRFDDGLKPYTALELKRLTGIPIRITNDLLYEMTQVHVLTELTNDEKGYESRYQPAEALHRLSVGTLIDRLESQGRWTLDLDVHKLDTPFWHRIISARSHYLDIQRGVLLKDVPA